MLKFESLLGQLVYGVSDVFLALLFGEHGRRFISLSQQLLGFFLHVHDDVVYLGERNILSKVYRGWLVILIVYFELHGQILDVTLDEVAHVVLSFRYSWLRIRVPAAVDELLLLHDGQMLLYLEILRELGFVEAFLRSEQHVFVPLLLEVDEHAILARECQLVEVLRYHLLSLDRMIVFLVRYETADSLLCLFELRELHLQQLIEQLKVLLQVVLFDAYVDLEVSLLKFTIHDSSQLLELVERQLDGLILLLELAHSVLLVGLLLLSQVHDLTS